MSFWRQAMVEATRDSIAKEIRQALLEIEKLEPGWTFEPPPGSPSYGRAPGERMVRLWSVPPGTGAFLRWLALDKECNRVVEIGTSAGYSTLWMADALRHKRNPRLDTWEILPEKTNLAMGFMAKAGVSDFVKVWNEDAKDFAVRYRNGPADLLFLDADKERYLEYLKASSQVLRPGGLLVVDNAVDFGALMVSFYELIRSSNEWHTVLLEMDNGILIARRI